MERLYIVNAKLITMAAEDYKNGYMIVGGGKIAEVGDMAELTEIPANAEVIDAEGAIVTPGMIDAHSHIGMWEDGIDFEGDDGNEDTDPITPQMRALDGVNPMDRSFAEAAEAGVTTVITGPGSTNPIAGQLLAMKTAGCCADDMIVAQPAGIKAAFGENPKSVYNEKGQSPATRMGTAAVIREALIKAKEYSVQLEKYESGEDGAEKPEWDFKSEALLPIIRRELPLHAHAHRIDDIFTAIRIAKEFNIRLILVHGTEAHLAAERIAEEKIPVLSGPVLTDRSKPELRNQTEAAAGILTAAGVKTALVTDHPETPEKFLPLCAVAAIRAGLAPMDALRAVTVLPAEICGISDRVGALAAGRDADFVIWQGEPMSVTFCPKAVYCGGKKFSPPPAPFGFPSGNTNKGVTPL